MLRNQLRIGGITVSLNSDRASDLEFLPPLAAFQIKAVKSDIDIQIRWVEKLEPALSRQVFDSGAVWRLYEHAGELQFDFCVPMLGESPYKRLRVDENFRSAELLMSKEALQGHAEAAAPIAYPLDELLIAHRLTRERAIELHSCGVIAPDGTATLFVGHSGAGKSTTARLWSEEPGVNILSDDRVIVREERTQIARLARDEREDSIRMYGTPWHGDAQFAQAASAALTRICILEQGRGNVLTRLGRGEAVGELFARSFVPLHRHKYVESALSFLEDLVTSVPCYRYRFEPNRGAVETLLNFHD